jgi:hypothetical protein
MDKVQNKQHSKKLWIMRACNVQQHFTLNKSLSRLFKQVQNYYIIPLYLRKMC